MRDHRRSANGFRQRRHKDQLLKEEVTRRLWPSHVLWPMPGHLKGFARFEKALEAGKNRGPTVRHGADEFGFGLLHFVSYCELDRLADGFELKGQFREAFGTKL